MKARLILTIVAAIAMSAPAFAQEAAAATAAPAANPQSQSGADNQGRRGGGRGGFGGGMGRGVTGAVTEVAADHYTVKTEAGETYVIHFSANTRIMKQTPHASGESSGRGGGQAQGRGEGGFGGGGNPPTAIKPTDIKVGDAVIAMGEVDATAKSVGAVAVIQVDPERAKEMRAMQANYGKTWLMGKVTAIDGVKVTLMGNVDNAPHAFVADENTTFRKRRDPITLADIQVGDMVRVDGAVKDGAFTATAVNAMGAPPRDGQNGPRNAPPQPPQ